LHIAEDSLEFLEESKIKQLLNNKFMPIPIKFGTKTEKIEQKKGESVDAEDKEETYKTVEVDNIINNPNPAWTKLPTELSDEDYKTSIMNCIQCNLRSLYFIFT
jgi:molecular chaperone HtpG